MEYSKSPHDTLKTSENCKKGKKLVALFALLILENTQYNEVEVYLLVNSCGNQRFVPM